MTDEIRRMVGKIKESGVADKRVLDAIYLTDRKIFVPENYKEEAYADKPLPIGYGQTISQPYTAARMCELLISNLKFTFYNEKVLEIGTGSGWQTCLLAKLYKQVFSVEIVPELAKRAKFTINNLQFTNIKIKTGDGKGGWQEYAPYDGIMCAANAQEIPRAWMDQLTIGGKIVCPVKGIMTRVIKRLSDSGIKYEKEEFGRYDFVPLV